MCFGQQSNPLVTSNFGPELLEVETGGNSYVWVSYLLLGYLESYQYNLFRLLGRRRKTTGSATVRTGGRVASKHEQT
jgi:hypothetical protein